MRIVDRHEMLALPDWTVFAEIHYGHLDAFSMSIKTMTIYADGSRPVDWVSTGFASPDCDSTEELMDRIMEMWQDPTVSYPLNPLEQTARDGTFDNKTRYLVYEKADVESIIALLLKAVGPNL